MTCSHFRQLFYATLIIALAAFSTFAQTQKLQRLVVVGDSLSAGFQSGSLNESSQKEGYAALIARQANTPLVQPLIAEPGLPNKLKLIDPGPPPIILPELGISYGRINPFAVATNLAVPGANVNDVLNDRPNFPIDGLTDFCLGFPWLFYGQPQTQVELARRLQPQTLIIWIGNNNVLTAALQGDATRITPLAQFQQQYSEMMNRLASTRAKLIVANIPDVTSTAYLFSANEVAETIGLPLSIIGPILGISAGDYVTPLAIPQIPQILANPSSGPLAPNVIVDRNEVIVIRAAVNNFNAFITQQAAAKGAALVDIRTLVDRVDRNGYPMGNRVLTTKFLGGLFSLDGVHPSNTGYAVIANEFIRSINARYNSGIPFVDVAAVANRDPLVSNRAANINSSAAPSKEAVTNLQTILKLDR